MSPQQRAQYLSLRVEHPERQWYPENVTNGNDTSWEDSGCRRGQSGSRSWLIVNGNTKRRRMDCDLDEDEPEQDQDMNDPERQTLPQVEEPNSPATNRVAPTKSKASGGKRAGRLGRYALSGLAALMLSASRML
ncbi:predicted protein [Coccidioides posadasii str. Silveira]|uniref:Predicted protein n=1 Tax=Coccidioides posadasii (strain RMSCC 757 / Silveira) TaxID=443226 RepID=E9DHK0_COCPS|nr:predicted protein [Coccidioides posadasii str. Silveira]